MLLLNLFKCFFNDGIYAQREPLILGSNLNIRQKTVIRQQHQRAQNMYAKTPLQILDGIKRQLLVERVGSLIKGETHEFEKLVEERIINHSNDVQDGKPCAIEQDNQQVRETVCIHITDLYLITSVKLVNLFLSLTFCVYLVLF